MQAKWKPTYFTFIHTHTHTNTSSFTAYHLQHVGGDDGDVGVSSARVKWSLVSILFPTNITGTVVWKWYQDEWKRWKAIEIEIEIKIEMHLQDLI